MIRLVDTESGRPVTERQVCFRQHGHNLALRYHGAGIYVLPESEKKDGKLTVAARGYLETEVEICSVELTGRYPEVHVALIPIRTEL